ncbi:von Willebrand factor A domain-containing protein 5B2 isoform X3 [Heterocephalus glaber]|uniref:von Willebrand factor A domain-containing protein 5B2 isoform X3 n=1 Tax=Heterocephalus glaber TaxID=10181 RepID=A0AAX6STN4_HETGA|nr:von Willebrand factor A domain-containing protein 5B2 isoform X3 [Heterocephalus glaber]
MPGLYCPSSWTPLPLTDSWVRACANGPCLSLRARLTYRNPQPQPVDGVFVYPLAEAEVVSGFEAEAAGRRVSFQLQSRRRSQAACCRALGPGSGASTPRRCAQGHLVLDLAQARSTLVLPTGLIAPAGTMTVTLSSSRELPSRPDGVLHVALPCVLTPLVPPDPPGPPRPPGLCDDRLGLCPTSCFGVGSPQEEGLPREEPAAPTDVFSGPARCPAPYTFSFEMLVTGPCLLAGLESPSHALRADAPPHASSAATICVTLAEGHRCDRSLEILLHPSEPHQPHLMLEAGSQSAEEYEAQVRARRDFQRLQRQRQDSAGDRQVWFLQRRFHKDILLNPVLVLSFCPDLSSSPGRLDTVTRELLFLLDGSSAAHKDAIVLAVKSLPSQTLVNLTTFGTSVQPLFPESRACSNDTVQLICENIEALQVAWGPPDVLAALDWALGQPQHRAHPRQLFLLTAASPGAATTHQALELMRWHRGAARCFSFGLGSGCRQLLQGLAVLSRGRAHFLRPGERLQPMLVQALRKALEPALSDISVDWFVPDAVEALLTPREIPALYPGDQLLGYCSLFRTDGFRTRPLGGQEPGWQSFGGSVFPSPEEVPSVISPGTELTGTSEPLGTGTASAELSSPWGARDSEQSTDALTDPVTDPGPNPSSNTAIWRRIFQSSYIQEQYVLTHCSASPEPGPGSTGSSESPGSQGPGSPEGTFPLDPPSQQGCRSLAWGEPVGSQSCPLPAPPQSSLKAGALSAEVLGRQHRAALVGRSLSSPPGWANPVPGQPRHPSLGAVLDGAVLKPGQQLGQGLDDSGTMDWDMWMEPPFSFTAVPPREEPAPPAEPLPPQAPHCHVVIRGLCGEQPMCWEVGVGLETLWGLRDGSRPPSPPGREAAWDQAFHRLTAASVVRDNEQLALRGGAESAAERGHARRSLLRALQTSKVSLAPSCFTCPVAVDAATREVLPEALQVRSSEPAEPPAASSASEGRLDAAALPTAEPSEGITQAGKGKAPPGWPRHRTSERLSAGAQHLDHNDNCRAALGDPTAPAGGPHRPLPQPPSWLSLGRRRRLCSPDAGPASEGNSEGSDHDYLALVRTREAEGGWRRQPGHRPGLLPPPPLSSGAAAGGAGLLPPGRALLRRGAHPEGAPVPRLALRRAPRQPQPRFGLISLGAPGPRGGPGRRRHGLLQPDPQLGLRGSGAGGQRPGLRHRGLGRGGRCRPARPQLGHGRGARVAGAPLRRRLLRVGTDGGQGRLLAAGSAPARWPRPGCPQGRCPRALPAAAPLGPEPPAPPAVLQPCEHVRAAPRCWARLLVAAGPPPPHSSLQPPGPHEKCLPVLSPSSLPHAPSSCCSGRGESHGPQILCNKVPLMTNPPSEALS